MINLLNEVMTFAEATAYLDKNVNYLADMVRAEKLIEGFHYRKAGRVKLILKKSYFKLKKESLVYLKGKSGEILKVSKKNCC